VRPPGLIGREKAVLVVVDVQERLFPAIHRRERVLGNIQRLIRFAQIVEMPIVLTEQYPEGLGPTVREVRDLVPGVQPIEKLEFNCFGSEAFRGRLRELRAETLILAGVEAHICVSQTALEGLGRYRVCVVSDAVSSRTAENRRAGLERVRDAGAVVASTEMLIYEILGRAGTKEFKEALKLVK